MAGINTVFQIIKLYFVPMASIKELYELCHSMDKAEKRFITMYINGLAGKSKENYLVQLENVWQSKTYDEDELKLRMKNISTKRISEFNSNLFEFISKGLMLYYSDKSESINLSKDAMLSEIYLQKGLYVSSEKVITRAIEKNSGYSHDEILVHFQKLRYKLGMKQFNSFDKQIELLDQKLEKLESVKSETAYQKLNFEMNRMFMTVTMPRTKEQSKVYDNFLNRPLLKDSSQAKSNYAMHYYYMIRIPLLNVVGRNKEALALSDEALKFTKSKFDLKKDPIPFFLQLKRNLSLQFAIGNPEKLMLILKEIKGLLDIQPELSNRIDIWSVELDVRINKAMLEQNYKEGISYFEKFAKDKLDKDFEKVNRLDAKALLIARIYFLDKNYEQSIIYADLASKGNRYKFKYAIIAAQFLSLINHFKLGNILMLPYSAKSLKRALQNEDILYAPEKALLSFLGKINNPDNIPKEFKKLQTLFLKEIKDPLNSTFFGNGDYLSWVEDELPVKT